jgi:glycosyltransferase involved in cell wall biosynthesis
VKIAFLTSCLEPGRDGVGDYTRRLAAECIRQGHPSVILALNDPHISREVYELQEMANQSISALRLPSVIPWKDRVVIARKWLKDFKPEWASLQFVTFGFHPKGLCVGLGRRLADINSIAPWHVMFHELWLGLGKHSSVKHRLWGVLQRSIVRDLISRLKPQMVHTQAEPYRMALERTGVKTSTLPLFGNIPLVKGDGWDSLLEPLLANGTKKTQARASLYLAGIFGVVHPEWNAEQNIDILLPLVQRSLKRLVLVFLGKNNLTFRMSEQLKSKLKGRAEIIMTGERTNKEISQILQSLDIGLSTSPRELIEKSGSVAAMLEYGLSVLVTRDDWHLRGTDAPVRVPSPRLLTPKQFSSLETLPSRYSQAGEGSNVKLVAERMLEAIFLHSV